jgi:hypothetical protein
MKLVRTVLILFLIAAGACSPSVPKLTAQPDPTNETVDSDSGVEVFDPEVDILFVVDDSGSMSLHQQNLIANIDKFVDAFTKRANIDYHIGVIGSGMETFYTNCCGVLHGFPNYVEKSTPNLVNVLKANLLMGTNGSGTERFFDPVMAALTPPLVDHDNAGFFRKDAHLALVFITDAEDQSATEVQAFYDFLVQLKGRKEKFISYAVMIPSTDMVCPRDEAGVVPTRLEKFLGMMPNAGNNEFSLCDVNFGDRVAQIADDLVRYVGNIIYLSRPPLIETIKVMFGTQEIPRDVKKGWAFDPARNALLIGDEIEWSVQPNGTKVRVYYEAATFPIQPHPTFQTR